MKPDDFAFFTKYIYDQTGLVLGPDKMYLIESRLAPLARLVGTTLGVEGARRRDEDLPMNATALHRCCLALFVSLPLSAQEAAASPPAGTKHLLRMAYEVGKPTWTVQESTMVQAMKGRSGSARSARRSSTSLSSLAS